MGVDAVRLGSDFVENLCDRLASSSALRLPGQLTNSGTENPSFQKRKDYLSALLLRDPGVFLERHGEMLSSEDRSSFDPLRGDYEVDFYLKLLEDQGDAQKRETTAKNRRLAYMNRLLDQGSFFSDEAMKQRHPYLHHQYIGQYTPPGEAGPSAAGTVQAPQQGGVSDVGGGALPLSNSLLRHQDELEAMLARRAEQERYDLVEEEEDSSDEGEGDEGGGGVVGGGGRQSGIKGGGGGGRRRGADGGGAGEEDREDDLGYIPISDAERVENAETFLDSMKERFLRGEEEGVDYRAIDADASLDDDWAEQAGRDAEEKYFDDGGEE